jgi:HTH-type transcriptional regulator / antitoxin HigA
MASSEQYRYEPDYAVPPGETLAELLEARGMTQVELSLRMGRPTKTINEIVQGKAAITPETALQLENVLGMPASFWNARERNYREALARREEQRRLETATEWTKQFPVKDMVRWGWIQRTRTEVEKLKELLRFFGIASPAEWESVWGEAQAEFRRSSAFASKPAAVSAWLRQGERQAETIECAPFDRESFIASLGDARRLTREHPSVFCRELPRLCTRSGVAVVFVPELPGAPISGATRMLLSSKALLQLSLRYKTDDHLWFTFFHEAGHIIKLRSRKVIIEDPKGDHGPEEAEADEFARDILIPPARYRQLTVGRSRYGKEELRSFAASIGVSPGIVVGRLQHDGKLPKTHCNDLKIRLKWAPAKECRANPSS